MPITINGSGTVTGLAVGGLPDGIVDTDMLATDAVTNAKVANDAINTNELVNNAVTAAKSSGLGGLTNATQFQLTSNEFNDTDPMTNWGLALETGQGTLGTAVTHSSGIFTFPDEGYWLVTANGQLTTGVSGRYSSIQINITTNNGSAWTIVSRGFGSCGVLQSANNMHGAHTTALVDVTDKAQVKVKFSLDFENEDVNNYFYGATDSNFTTCQFLRLGAT